MPVDDETAIELLRLSPAMGIAEAVLVVRRFVSLARAAGRTKVLGHALCRLAQRLNLADDTAAAEEAAAEALGLFEFLNDPGGQAMARNVAAMARFTRGDYAGALELLHQALDQARPLGEAGALLALLNGLGSTLSAVGDPRGAAQAFEEALTLTPQSPADPRHCNVCHNLVMALARWAEQERDAGLPATEWLPRAEHAIALAEATLDGEASSGRPPSPAGLSNLALALLVAGRPERALDVLERPELRTIDRDSTFAALHLAQTRARALIDTGRASEAVGVCQEALARASGSRTELQTDMLWLILSQAHEACGDFKAALQAHRKYFAAHAHLVFERAERSARASVLQLDLARAQRESRVDPLTGIANRRDFEERLKARLSRVRSDEPVSLLLIDVDRFKDINDSLGHAAGDGLLRMLAGVLQSVCRGVEQPARLGGDEFVVVVDGGEREAGALAERVRLALRQAQAEPRPGSVPQPACTLSIGLATTVGPCALEQLMAHADRAMYAAKSQGRNRVNTVPAAPDPTGPRPADCDSASAPG